MANKNSSSVGFWVAMVGGGFVILLLAAWSLYSSNVIRSAPSASRGMMGFATGGTVTSIAPATPPMMINTLSPTKESIGANDMFFAPVPSPIPPVPPPIGGDTAATATPRIIKNASLSLEVKSARDSAKMVSNVATLNGGFVENSNIIENADGTTSAYVTIRVPQTKFDDTISSLTGLALTVSTENVTGQDVTEQYTDLQARLTAAQAEEQQYLDILKKATNVQDILSVTQYLTQVRSEIESLQGQIKNLGNQTAYSTISVTLTEQANLNVPNGKFDLIRDMKQAGQSVILLGQAFLTFAVWFIIIGGAFLIPLLIIGYLIYKLVKRIVRS